MNLIGSLTEKKIGEELLISWKRLNSENDSLMNAIKSEVSFLKSAFVMGWTPDQSEDIYTVIVNSEEIFYIEIDRDTGAVLELETCDLNKYKRSLRSRLARIQLAVALDLGDKIESSDNLFE